MVKPAWLALAAVLAIGTALRFAHHLDVDSRSPDEQTYTDYATQIADYGIGAFPVVFADYASAGDLWTYPAPTRVGQILLMAAAMRLEKARDARTGADISLAASVLVMALVAWIGASSFDPWAGVAAAAFLAVSVTELGIARRAWTDSMAGLMSTLLVAITCVIARPENRKRSALYVLFLAVGCAAMLVKESLAVYYGVCGLWLTASLAFQDKSWKGAAALAMGGVASVAAALGIVRLLCGDAAIFAAIVPTPGNWLLPHPNSWTAENYTGTWYEFFAALFKIGPITAIMAVAGAFFLPRERRAMGGILAAVAGVCLFFVTFAPALKCLRLLSPADGCFALLAGIGLTTLARKLPARAGVTLAAAALAVECICNYRTFTAVVVDTGMEDLAMSGLRFWLR